MIYYICIYIYIINLYNDYLQPYMPLAKIFLYNLDWLVIFCRTTTIFLMHHFIILPYLTQIKYLLYCYLTTCPKLIIIKFTFYYIANNYKWHHRRQNKFFSLYNVAIYYFIFILTILLYLTWLEMPGVFINF